MCDCEPWQPDCVPSRGMFHKVFCPLIAEQDNASFLKALSFSLSKNDSLEGKEKNSCLSSVPLILLDSLFYLPPVCKCHTQLAVAASLSCMSVLHTSSVFPLFLSSGFCSASANADFRFHMLTPVLSRFVSPLVLSDLAKSSAVLKPNPVQL